MARQQLPTAEEITAPPIDAEQLEQTLDAELTDPKDYSAVGGPDNEPAYGRSRAFAGEYPFNEHGGSHDVDEPSHIERGGIMSHHHVTKQT